MPSTDTDTRNTAAPDAHAALEACAGSAVATLGFELVHLDWIPGRKRHTLRLFIDYPEGAETSVGVDDCARASRVVSLALDSAEAGDTPALSRLLAGAYNLEVSSPGIERPLSRLPHFRRFVGRLAEVKTSLPLGEGDQKNFKGTIEGVEEDPSAPADPKRGTVLIHDRSLEAAVRIPIPRIRRAHLVYEGSTAWTK